MPPVPHFFVVGKLALNQRPIFSTDSAITTIKALKARQHKIPWHLLYLGLP
ncbi:MAG: hypothetical protein LBB34_03785 [Holosporales bacterium]|nr:hypothetical protein [Holosporales bacterium]